MWQVYSTIRFGLTTQAFSIYQEHSETHMYNF